MVGATRTINRPKRETIRTEEPSQTKPNKRTDKEKQPYRRTNIERRNQIEECKRRETINRRINRRRNTQLKESKGRETIN